MTTMQLYAALGGIDPAYVAEAEAVFRRPAGRTVRLRRKRLWRTVLLAAALTALFTATAYAAGLFGLSARQYPLGGETEQVITVPNGLEGTATYEGTGEWWSFVYAYRDEHPELWKNPDWSFAGTDDALRSTCRLYGAYDRTMADKLRAIAQKYGLTLYAESVSAADRDRLLALTGIGDFLPEGGDGLRGGYVFADGSFKAEGRMEAGGAELWYALYRFGTGAIYPIGGSTEARDFEEWRYESARGHTLDMVLWNREEAMIGYASPDGRFFVELCPALDLSDGQLQKAGYADRRALLEGLADQVDFDALCRADTAARQLIETPRGALDNRDAAERLRAFDESPVFRAAEEFHEFFTATFYGNAFTGVYGQEGYADIDAKLEELSARYGLQFAREKTVGDRAYPDSTIYDNGAWVAVTEIDAGRATIQYIPKTALFTRLIHYAPFADYARVWEYTTPGGATVVCAAEGPEKLSGTYLFYETESAWVLVSLNQPNLDFIERAADAIDWAAFA